jgi:sigma-B regulation protein RsbU (phosphoserine phosphatase)
MRMESTGYPLGVMADTEYISASPITLQPGEIVLFLTDGILEACESDSAPFGIDRALDVVRANRSCAAQEIVAALYAEVCKYCASKKPLDDITMIVLKVDSAA